MAGGPTVNIADRVLASSAALFATYGNPARRGPPHHGRARSRPASSRPPRTDASAPPSDPVSPAKQAGLQAGDRFVSFNGTPDHDWTDMQDLIRGNDERRRHDRRRARRPAGHPAHQHHGHAAAHRRERPDQAHPGRLPRRVARRHATPPAAPLYTDRADGRARQAVGAGAGHPAGQGLGGRPRRSSACKPRAADSPVSVVGGGRLAGETASAQDFPLKEKLVSLLVLVAGFNFFIGLFNFVPLLPLDGGHIAGALWEAVRRGIARLRGRPDPGYVDVAKLLPVAYVVASFLLVMGVVLIVGDLVVPVQISLTIADRRGTPRDRLIWRHDRRQPGHARGTPARARPPPSDPPDQGRQGRGRQRLPDLGAVDDHDADRRRQHHAPADRRADRLRLRHRAGRVPEPGRRRGAARDRAALARSR